MSSSTAGSDTEREREEFIGVLRALALPPEFDNIPRRLLERSVPGAPGYVTTSFFLAIRKFPAFRRALCVAVAEETGMKVAEVVALATPKE